MKGDLLKTITDKIFTVDLASLSDKILMNDFANEKHCDLRGQGRKSTRNHTLIKLLKSPGLMASASGVAKTLFLSSDPDEICDRLTLLLQQTHAGNNSNIINEEIIAIIDKLLECKGMTQTQHKQIIKKIESFIRYVILI